MAIGLIAIRYSLSAAGRQPNDACVPPGPWLSGRRNRLEKASRGQGKKASAEGLSMFRVQLPPLPIRSMAAGFLAHR